MDVDAVFTWVDGSDPQFLAEKARYADLSSIAPPPGWEGRSSYTGEAESRSRKVKASHAMARFRDKEELRYALRSINDHAPWIRHIHIVTNGQIPRWLNVSHPSISIVPHSRLFEDQACLPTFNSNAIESTIHRIPALSENFIYFNDDFFLGRKVGLDAFIDHSGRHRLFVEDARKIPRDMTDRSMIAHSWAFNNALLDDSIAVNTNRKMFAHTPQIYNKYVLMEIQLLWREHFERTRANRFRTPFDAAFRLLYTGYVSEGKRALLTNRSSTPFGVTANVSDLHYSFIKVGDRHSDYRSAMLSASKRRPQFVCVNDELPDDATFEEQTAVSNLTRRFLEDLFPEPSPFERNDAPILKHDRSSGSALTVKIGVPAFISGATYAPCMEDGWYPAESDGAWSCGPKALIRLKLVDFPDTQKLKLIYRGRIIGTGLKGGRLLRATAMFGPSISDAAVGEFLLDEDGPFELAMVVQRPRHGWGHQGTIEFSRLIAPSPAELNYGSDHRKLGIFIESLEIGYV